MFQDVAWRDFHAVLVLVKYLQIPAIIWQNHPHIVTFSALAGILRQSHKTGIIP
jgi:hypothetical protein